MIKAQIVGLCENDKSRLKSSLPNLCFIDITDGGILKKKDLTPSTVVFGYTNEIKAEHLFAEHLFAEHLFIVEYLDKRYESELINLRIDKYRQQICEGGYDLRLLDLDRITHDKKILSKKINKTHIKLDTDEIIERLRETPQTLYIGSLKLYKKIIPISAIRKDLERLELRSLIKKLPIYGYQERWLGILSITDSSKLKKGIIDTTPFVEEIEEDGLNILQNSGYLYTIQADRVEKNGYKFSLFSDAKILKTEHITNVGDELRKDGVKLIKLNL